MIKRSFDILSSLFGMILLAPVLIGVGVLIRSEDGGPIFYRGVRVGRQPPTQSPSAVRLVDEPFGCETCRRAQVVSLRAERLKSRRSGPNGPSAVSLSNGYGAPGRTAERADVAVRQAHGHEQRRMGCQMGNRI